MKGEGICRSRFGFGFEMARLFAGFWIPAFAGMTGVEGGNGAGAARLEYRDALEGFG